MKLLYVYQCFSAEVKCELDCQRGVWQWTCKIQGKWYKITYDHLLNVQRNCSDYTLHIFWVEKSLTIYITSSPVSTTICSMMKGHISVTCNAPNLLPTHQLKWYSNCKVELKQWNLLRCNTPSCWSANTQSLLHTWNTLWWLQTLSSWP